MSLFNKHPLYAPQTSGCERGSWILERGATGLSYVTTGYAQAIALNARDGKELWRTNLSAPSRSGPTVVGDQVYAITIDNQLHALGTADGKKAWTHSGITEVAGLFGGASPASDGRTIVVPYSSGELFAFGVDSGRTLWSESLAGVARGDAVATLADIRGLPVIDRGRVIAVSNSGTLTAIDLERGGRLWNASIGSSQTPWVAGDFIYILSTNDELIVPDAGRGTGALDREFAAVPEREGAEDPIAWSGPVLVSDRLVVTSSAGDALSMSPYTGDARAHHLPSRPPAADRGQQHDVYPLRQRGADGVPLTGGRPMGGRPCPSPWRSSAGRMSANRRCSTGWSASGWR